MTNLSTGFKQISKVFLRLLQSLEIRQGKSQQLKPLKQMEQMTPLKRKKLASKWRIAEDDIQTIHDIGSSGNMTAFVKKTSELFQLDLNDGLKQWVPFSATDTVG